ncbi:MAG: glycosyltransferase family 39 protein [Anaerolineae bacterium]|nr:glycosyltransferase family 39 protein [Anaerolineae bacterium]
MTVPTHDRCPQAGSAGEQGVISLRWLLIAALVIGIALRTMQFRQIPPGLYRDEAYNGMDALNVLRGDIRVFYDTNFGREGLFIWLTALSVWFWGASPLAVRFPSLVIGILTLFTCYGMTKELYGRRIGTFTTAIFAIMVWHVHFSRVGFRAVLVPLFTSLGVWCVARGIRVSKNYWLGLGGMAAGSLIYTYIAARTAILPVSLFIIYVWRRRRSVAVPTLQQWLWFTLPALAVMLPFLFYTIAHWESVFLRTQVAVGLFTVSNPVQLLARNLFNTLAMFIFRGDFLSRHNVPLRPVFDPALGIMFCLGVWLAIRRFRRDYGTAFLVFWLLAMLLPSILTEDCPHFIRAIGILPFVAILPALGLDWCWKRLSKIGHSGWGTLFVVVILLIGLGSTAWDYFVRYPTMSDINHKFEFETSEQSTNTTPGAYRKLDWSKDAWRIFAHPPSQPGICYRFECAGVELANEINSYLETGWTRNTGRVIPQPGRSDRQVFVQYQLWKDVINAHFLIPDSPGFNVPQDGLINSVAPKPALPMVFYGWYNQYYPEFWVAEMQTLLPPNSLVEVQEGMWTITHQDWSPHPAYLKFTATPSAIPNDFFAQFAQGISLVSGCVTPQPQGIAVLLTWYADRPIQADYKVFVHYERDQQIIAQADAYPAYGYHRTYNWRVGDQLLDTYVLSVSGNVVNDRIWVGLYTEATLERLPVLNATTSTADNRIMIPLSICVKEPLDEVQ